MVNKKENDIVKEIEFWVVVFFFLVEALVRPIFVRLIGRNVEERRLRFLEKRTFSLLFRVTQEHFLEDDDDVCHTCFVKVVGG